MSLLAAPLAGQAMVKHKTKQGFGFIDFGKLPNKIENPKKGQSTEKFGRVTFDEKDKGNKGRFRFDGPMPVPGAADQGTISVELVALSLTSVEPVSLAPLFGPRSGATGNILLELVGRASDRKAPVDKKRKKFDFELAKFLKVTGKDQAGQKKSKMLSSIPVKANDVAYRQSSLRDPIEIAAPFCMQTDQGQAVDLCMAPLGVPEPRSTLAMLGLSLGVLVLAIGVRRRRSAFVPA